MKKITCILLAAMAFTLLASCKKEPDFSETVIIGQTDTASDTESPLPDKDEASSNDALVFTLSEYKEETEHYSAVLCYPVTEGIPNAGLINAALYDHLLALMYSDLNYTFVGESFLTYTLDSIQLTFSNDRIASFLCIGSAYPDGAAHPTEFVHTLNIDLDAARLYDSSEIIADFDRLSEHFISGAFALVPGDSKELDGEIEALSKADLMSQYNAAYGIYPPVYLVQNGDTASLAVSVELVYALGSHAEFAAPLFAVEDALSDNITELTKGNK